MYTGIGRLPIQQVLADCPSNRYWQTAHPTGIGRLPIQLSATEFASSSAACDSLLHTLHSFITIESEVLTISLVLMSG